ncbi:MAG: ATP-grasp domain-containing protein [Synechococcales bacterium]|nr:ATP-grasp domain-containing protein [Synechococcales bacterium]
MESAPPDKLMDLLEYQAKDLFRAVGIPVLPSQRIDRPKDLKTLTIPYPIVLKSQVYIGGRGRVGGVRFVSNTIDAIAAAQTIFNLPIMGEYPKTLLAEAKFEAEQELYLAITLNRSIRRPVLLGSLRGGTEVQEAIDQMQQVVVEEEFSPFYARRLALQMGLQGELMNAVSDVLEKMYRLFVDKDLDLVEINPLAVDEAGQVMALDGKVSVNDGALGRHPDIVAMSELPVVDSLERPPELQLTMDPDGQLGVLCNGAGLTMATMDMIYQGGGKPIAFINIGSETHSQWQPETFCQRLETALEQLLAHSQVRVILISLVGGIVPCDAIAKTIVQFLRGKMVNVGSVSRYGRRTPRSPGQPTGAGSAIPFPNAGEKVVSRVMMAPELVVRLVGTDIGAAKTCLGEMGIDVFEDLEEAIAYTVKLMSPGKGSKS